MADNNFTTGQILAMKVVIGIMIDRAHDRDFDFDTFGMEWLGAMNTPAVVDEDGQVIMVQDLFDASLVVAWSAISHLARSQGAEVDQIIQAFAVSVAEAEVNISGETE